MAEVRQFGFATGRLVVFVFFSCLLWVSIEVLILPWADPEIYTVRGFFLVPCLFSAGMLLLMIVEQFWSGWGLKPLALFLLCLFFFVTMFWPQELYVASAPPFLSSGRFRSVPLSYLSLAAFLGLSAYVLKNLWVRKDRWSLVNAGKMFSILLILAGFVFRFPKAVEEYSVTQSEINTLTLLHPAVFVVFSGTVFLGLFLILCVFLKPGTSRKTE